MNAARSTLTLISLRRTHFNPRKKGRRSKGEEHEKRGGKGGGHWPPMNHLKDNWMKEIEEMVTDDLPPLEDPNDDAGEDVDPDQVDDLTSPELLDMSPADPNAFSCTGSNFNNSPIDIDCSPMFIGDMEMNMNIPNVNFTDMMLHCEGDLMSQAASLYSGSDMFTNANQAYLHHAVGYKPIMNGPM
jgi:hypothetical protein